MQNPRSSAFNGCTVPYAENEGKTKNNILAIYTIYGIGEHLMPSVSSVRYANR
jgi:hypothetical protein